MCSRSERGPQVRDQDRLQARGCEFPNVVQLVHRHDRLFDVSSSLADWSVIQIQHRWTAQAMQYKGYWGDLLSLVFADGIALVSESEHETQNAIELMGSTVTQWGLEVSI